MVYWTKILPAMLGSGGTKMEKKDIDRINELAHKAKKEGLTEAETTERDELRRRYIADIRAAVQDQLAHTIVEEPDGTRHPLLKKEGGQGADRK